MTFSFSGDFSQNSFTAVENAFISGYLPSSPGNAVKIYLFGLYLCAKSENEYTLSSIAEELDMTEEEVKSALSYWEELGLIVVRSYSPLMISYQPLKTGGASKPRKFKAEKYAEFSKSLQGLLPSRMISTSEFSEYFLIMETYKIAPEAMLLIVKYCADKKGGHISYRYVSKVAKDFGERSINTVEKVEKELSSYVLRTGIIEKVLSALSIKRQPDIEDLNLLKKWTKELEFEPENIIYAAKQLKKGSINKLDDFLLELYSLKCFSKEEIKDFFSKKQEIIDLTIKINRALSIYVEVLDTEIDTYVNKWVSYGFMSDALLFIASRLFKVGKNNLQEMDTLVEYLRNRGLIDLSSIGDYVKEQERSDEFIKKLLEVSGVNRRPTHWDRENLATWKSWNFTDDMILEAGKLASGKSSPIAYINGILSNWKNNSIFTLDSITDKAEIRSGELNQEEYNREYKSRRANAMAKAQKNLDKAMEIDGFASLYERIFGIEKDLAFAEISGDSEKLLSLEKEKVEISKNIDKMLSKIGLEFSDLSPKYICEKCNDTGYVGTDRCDCFNKK